MTPLVTVGIPCFNSAPFLRQSLESALAQTWPQIQVIVADDGSTDDSLAIARSFGEKVRVISGGHRGGNHARNQVLAAAGGEWLQFLDADDYLEPEKIAQQFAETNGGENADVIYSPVWWETSREGKVVSRVASAQHFDRDLFAQWLAWELLQTGGGLWRKAALERIGGWKEGQPCCQDNELCLRAIMAELRFVFAPTPHAVYRLWSEQTLCRRDPAQVIEVKTALLEQLRSWMQARRLWRVEHERTTGRAFFEMARTLAKSDLAHAARYHAARRAHGLVQAEGPAAPAPYRATYKLFGFKNAERLAAWVR